MPPQPRQVLMLRFIAACVVGLVAMSGRAVAQEAVVAAHDAAIRSATDTIRPLLAAFHERAGFPGATIGFVLPGDGSEHGSVSVGLAFKETGERMTAEHRMMAGSTGKTFYAAVALQLAGEGVLDLDAKISTWLGDEPWFDRLPNADDITLRMLMNHTSGWPEYVGQPALIQAIVDDPDKHFATGEQLSYIVDLEPVHPAGEGWSYSDTNYIAVSMIIEKATGDACPNLIFNRLLRPHELWDITPSTSRDMVGMAGGYDTPGDNLFRLEKENVIQNGRFVFNPQMEGGGGGFASTPEALARWAYLLYSGGVLQEATQKAMRTTVEARRLGPNARYGLALIERPSDLGTVIGHSGFFPGYLTDMSHYVDHDLSLAFQVNTSAISRELNPRAIQRLLDECAKAILEEGE